MKFTTSENTGIEPETVANSELKTHLWIRISHYLVRIRNSRSFHQQAKEVRKTMISTILYLFLTFIYENRWKCPVPSKSSEQKNLFFVGILSVTDEIAGSSSELPKFQKT